MMDSATFELLNRLLQKVSYLERVLGISETKEGDGAAVDTDGLAEGSTNLYFTNERAQDAVGTILTDSSSVDFTYNDGANTITAAVIDDSISNAKLRNSGALSVIGRSANSSGDPADISAVAASGAVLRESGSVLGFGTIATAGIADDAVTAAKLANMAANTVRANNTGSIADPLDVDATTWLSQYYHNNYLSASNAFVHNYLVDVADITSTQSCTIDLTFASGAGNMRTFVTYIDFVAHRSSASNIYAVMHGSVCWHYNGSGSAVILSHSLAHATSGTDASSVSAITNGIRFLVDSSAFGNTLDVNTLRLTTIGNAGTGNITVSTVIA